MVVLTLSPPHQAGASQACLNIFLFTKLRTFIDILIELLHRVSSLHSNCGVLRVHAMLTLSVTNKGWGNELPPSAPAKPVLSLMSLRSLSPAIPHSL